MQELKKCKLRIANNSGPFRIQPGFSHIVYNVYCLLCCKQCNRWFIKTRPTLHSYMAQHLVKTIESNSYSVYHILMETNDSIQTRVRTTARIRILFLPHALRQMLRPDRMITNLEVQEVIFNGKVIEDYPDDMRGHSCLLLGYGNDTRPIHVVCAPHEDYLAVITAYIPYEEEWSDDFKTRIK